MANKQMNESIKVCVVMIKNYYTVVGISET